MIIHLEVYLLVPYRMLTTLDVFFRALSTTSKSNETVRGLFVKGWIWEVSLAYGMDLTCPINRYWNQRESEQGNEHTALSTTTTSVPIF
jgi:hypothetical protein